MMGKMEPLIKTLDAEQLRRAMRAWSSGVALVTVAYNGERHGMTVSSFTSVSLDPPLIIISLQSASRTQTLVNEAGTFAVTILGEDQQKISDRFAGRGSEDEDRFAGLETETFVTGAPIIKGLSSMDCRVVQTIAAGMNTIFLAEVVAARGEGEGRPLIYHDRRYWQLPK